MIASGWNRLAIAGLIGLTSGLGCASREKQFRYDSFARIQPHVTSRAEVVELLGEPDHRVGDDWWMYRRPEEHLHAIIEFDESGQVTRKQWIDPSGDQVWEDSAEKGQGP